MSLHNPILYKVFLTLVLCIENCLIQLVQRLRILRSIRG